VAYPKTVDTKPQAQTTSLYMLEFLFLFLIYTYLEFFKILGPSPNIGNIVIIFSSLKKKKKNSHNIFFKKNYHSHKLIIFIIPHEFFLFIFMKYGMIFIQIKIMYKVYTQEWKNQLEQAIHQKNNSKRKKAFKPGFSIKYTYTTKATTA
jgi:hypothetical protein